MERRRIIIVFSVLFVFFALPLQAEVTEALESGNEEFSRFIDSAKLEARLNHMRELSGVVEEAALDTEDLLERFDYEPEPLIRFVKHEIAYEPYTGALRGASGVIRSKAGNSLDQAILLATLLNDAGFETRIASGTLDKKGWGLLFEAAHKANDASAHPELVSFGAALKKLENSSIDAERSQTDKAANPPWLDQVLVSAAEIEAAVASTRQLAAPGPFEFHSQYYCVQYRETVSGGWSTAHPAIPSDETGIGFSPAEYFKDSVPEAHQHRVSFQVFLERTSLGELDSVPITPLYSYPTANHESLSWTYQSVPDRFLDLEVWTPESMENAFMASKRFFPQVNQSVAPGGQVFDLQGNAVPMDVAMSTYAGIIDTVGGKFSDLSNAIFNMDGSDEEHQPVRYASKLWVEITLSSPGGASQSFQRPLAEWDGDPESFQRQLARGVTITLETGRPSFVDFLSRMSGAEIRVLEYLSKGTNQTVPADEDNLIADGRFFASIEGNLFFLFSDLLADQLTQAKRVRFQPSIVARYRSSLSLDVAMDGFDVISNDRAALPGADPEVAFRSSILNGVSDTLIEKIVVGIFSQVQNSSFDELVARPPGSEIHVNPAQPLDSGSGWWSVNLSTGNTIGRLANGWGGVSSLSMSGNTCFALSQTLVEYVKQMAAQSAKVWGASQFRNIQYCAFLTMGIAVAAQLTHGANMPGLTGMCDQVPDPTLQVACTATVWILKGVSNFINLPQGQSAAREGLRRFFAFCTRYLRTGRVF